MSSRLPNLIIAGTVKAGTTSLFSYLSRHPEICGSAIKETCYFLPLRYGNAMESLEKYRHFFSSCEHERYVIEATPGYFDGGRTVAEAIKRVLGEVRILIVLRDPVKRLVSFFRYHRAQIDLPKDLDLSDYVRLCEMMPVEERKKKSNDHYWGIDGGYYAAHLREWFDVFGADQVRIIFFEQLTEDPRRTMQDLCAWLDIDGRMYDTMEFHVENRTVPYRFAMLQRLAIRINTSFEGFFRRHPLIKQTLRDIYYKCNFTADASGISAATETFVRQLYAGSNEETARLLKSHGYSTFPSWLEKKEDGPA